MDLGVNGVDLGVTATQVRRFEWTWVSFGRTWVLVVDLGVN